MVNQNNTGYIPIITKTSMDKAIKTTKLKCKLGHTTLVLTEKGEFLFRAYETARLFGFRDDKECIRSYSRDARLIVMETDGGGRKPRTRLTAFALFRKTRR